MRLISEPEAIENLAHNVRELMNVRGWSQADLARRAGIPEMQISRIVRAKQQAGFFYVARLIEAFDCSFDRLIRERPKHSHALRAG